ncbi:MAG: hypothetical protein ACM3SS_12000, partial [Rhodospirillaceae bacterium]
AAPLVGVMLAGQPAAPYLAFPPRTVYAAHAPFSWLVFGGMTLPAAGAAALYGFAIRRGRRDGRQAASLRPQYGFPWWGSIGIALVAGGWTMAWSRGFLPAAWQRHTFTPLWLGYVIVVNALAYRRSGRALLTHEPRILAALFAASAAFWWLFEYLNQYTDNWHYTGVQADTDWDYFLQATLPFSTVLPAVASTRAWLATYPALDALMLRAVRGRPAYAWMALLGGTLAVGAMGLLPEMLYPMLWLGPAFMLAGLQYLVLGVTSLSPLAGGDWRPVLQPALAALVCGLFWEMWNYGSLARWHYSIPYVDRFHVFEMPLLGYAGYLPFGIECALVIDLVRTLCGNGAATARITHPDRR